MAGFPTGLPADISPRPPVYAYGGGSTSALPAPPLPLEPYRQHSPPRGQVMALDECADGATGPTGNSRERTGSYDAPQLGLHREYYGTASVTNFTAFILKGLSLDAINMAMDEDASPREESGALIDPTRNGRHRRTLPSPDFGGPMLHIYFANAHQLYPFIHERTFIKDYGKLYAALKEGLPEQFLYGRTCVDLTEAVLTPDQDLHMSLIEGVFAMVEKMLDGDHLKEAEAQTVKGAVKGHCELADF